MRRRDRTDRGVTVVEAAFAMPILFLFIAGLVDIGMWVFNANQAANAARDGARQGILDFELADVAGSGDYNSIVAVMEEHLPGHTFATDDVDVECIDPDGNVRSCSIARVDRDRIRVTAHWHWDLVTPIARTFMGSSRGEVAGTATMALVGRPLPGSGPPPSTTTTAPSTTTTTPGPTTTTIPPTTTTTIPCTVTNLAVSPVQTKSNGTLQNNVTVSFQRNNVPACGTITVQLQAPQGGSASQTCGCGSGPTYSWVYGKNANSFWTKTNATSPPKYGYVRVFNDSSVIAELSFTVT